MSNKEYPYIAKDVFNLCGKYMNDDELNTVKRAYDLEEKAHVRKFSKNGFPYILHPVQVAGILAELKLDMLTIVAGFLHYFVEVTDYYHEDLIEMFNEEFAVIVDGV